MLRRVENERDDAMADLRRMTTERDTLRERLKIATETQIADRSRLEQRIEDVEVALRAVSVEAATRNLENFIATVSFALDAL